jgi:hypothetical protein
MKGVEACQRHGKHYPNGRFSLECVLHMQINDALQEVNEGVCKNKNNQLRKTCWSYEVMEYVIWN